MITKVTHSPCVSAASLGQTRADSGENFSSEIRLGLATLPSQGVTIQMDPIRWSPLGIAPAKRRPHAQQEETAQQTIAQRCVLMAKA